MIIWYIEYCIGRYLTKQIYLLANHNGLISSMKIFENIISDRGSKYAVSGSLVTTRDEIGATIKLLKKNKKFAKATHNSWAIVFSDLGPIKSDDGEAGAGMVIVRMLQRKEIHNHLIVVSRWFGGVQLGGDRYRRIRDCVNYYFENYDK